MASTSVTHSLAGAQATAMMQATTVLTAKTCAFSQKFAKNLSERQNFVKKYKEKE
jgi:hypothetical protein